MPQGLFQAQVSDWVLQAKERIELVVKESAQEVVAEMQAPGPSVANPSFSGDGRTGNMPVASGFLRASLMASTDAPILRSVENPDPEAKYTYNAGQVSLVIAGAQLGQALYFTYGANYARHVEYGARGRPGRAFVRLAAQKWPQIVARVSAQAQSQVEGRRGR